MAESKAKLSQKQTSDLIVELAKEGNSPTQIGTILRDKHGIPKFKLTGKKITQVLDEADVPYITEESIIESKIEKIKTHLEKNKSDHKSKISLSKRLWQLHHLKQ